MKKAICLLCLLLVGCGRYNYSQEDLCQEYGFEYMINVDPILSGNFRCMSYSRENTGKGYVRVFSNTITYDEYALIAKCKDDCCYQCHMPVSII